MSDFSGLGNDEQLRRLDELATRAASDFGLDVEHRSLLQYEDNAVYRLRAHDGGEYVLRVTAEVGCSAQEQASELEWLQSLRMSGLLVPEPIASPRGEFVLQVRTQRMDSRSCVLFRWLPGEVPQQDISEPQLRRLGAATARLHRASRSFVPSACFLRSRIDGASAYGADSASTHTASSHPSLAAELLPRLGQRLGPELDALATRSESTGLIHGDLYQENVLLTGDQISLIDFDDCGWGHYLFDIACLLDSFKRRVLEPATYPRARAALLEGYQPSAASNAELDRQLATLKALRDAISLRFILASSNQAVQSWAGERIVQLVRHLENYLNDGPAEI